MTDYDTYAGHHCENSFYLAHPLVAEDCVSLLSIPRLAPAREEIARV